MKQKTRGKQERSRASRLESMMEDGKAGLESGRLFASQPDVIFGLS